MKKIFLTGTCTEVGKTTIACQILDKARAYGLKTIVSKPIASGSLNGVNADVLALQASASISQSTAEINPWVFEEPIAPHIAAAKANIDIRLEDLHQYYQKICTYNADLLLMEGAGGWCVPINFRDSLSDFVLANDLDIVLVVKMTLGCLNHTILSIENICSKSSRFVGWVANHFGERMPYLEENIDTLAMRFGAPLSIENIISITN